MDPPRGDAVASGLVPPVQLAADPVRYDSGDPTDEEQLYLELINRARANPQAEAIRLANPTDSDIRAAYDFFQVNTGLLIEQFASMVPAPPLAMNAVLLAAGRQHSRWMLDNGRQSHNEGALTTGTRLQNAGYLWNQGGGYGENVFAFANSVLHGHYGFNTDWGAGPGGMQSPPGHRNSIHASKFTEAGIGVVFGTNTGPSGKVGPQLVTQEFGYLTGQRPYVVGVAFQDWNGNGFYDVGEGLAGIRVDVEGSAHYAVTSTSGGYAVPFVSTGLRRVSFSGTAFTPREEQVSLAPNTNLKLDFVPPLRPAVIRGPSRVRLASPSLWIVDAIEGASSYLVALQRLTPVSAVEGAETDLSAFDANVSPGYSVLASDVKQEGARSFHLAHPAPPTSQSLVYKAALRPRADAEWTFYSRLGWSTTNQIARAQLSLDGGSTWVDVWSQPGAGNAGESIFTLVRVPMSSYADRVVRLRLIYQITSGSYFSQTAPGVGWYVDSIALAGFDRLEDVGAHTLGSSGEWSYEPSETGTFLASATAQVSGRTAPRGPSFELSVVPTVPAATVILRDISFGGARSAVAAFTSQGAAFTSVLLQSAEALNGEWSTRGGDWNVSAGGEGELTVPAPPYSHRFFRLLLQ